MYKFDFSKFFCTEWVNPHCVKSVVFHVSVKKTADVFINSIMVKKKNYNQVYTVQLRFCNFAYALYLQTVLSVWNMCIYDVFSFHYVHVTELDMCNNIILT